MVAGAGYIGNHMVKCLGELGCGVTTLDNLSNSHHDAVLCGDFVRGNLADRSLLKGLIQPGSFDAVMHFASFIQVVESVQKPAMFHENNVSYTLHLLDTMRAAGVQQFFFSSTAATFGEPQYTPINERPPQAPVSPYGRSKLMIEQVLEDYNRTYDLKSVCLRYFNAAGTDPDGQREERHNPETHLIPLVLQAARQQLGWQPQFADLETMVRHAWGWENRLRANHKEPAS